MASDGRQSLPPLGAAAGVLLRDLDLVTLVAAAGEGAPWQAVDLDSVEGLNPDAAAVQFVTKRLGIEIVMTRRPAVAERVAELGYLALLHIFAFNSTGLGRSLEGQPSRAGIGTVISPGLVVAHLSADDLARLPRPLLAYGLIDSPDRARALLRYADGVIVRADCAAGIVTPVSRSRSTT